MNPLHHRSTAGARTSEDLVPEAHGYGYIASSEAAPAAPSQTVPDAHGYGYVVVSDDAPAAEVAEPVSAAPSHSIPSSILSLIPPLNLPKPLRLLSRLLCARPLLSLSLWLLRWC